LNLQIATKNLNHGTDSSFLPRHFFMEFLIEIVALRYSLLRTNE
jgi:hypothetical protein